MIIQTVFLLFFTNLLTFTSAQGDGDVSSLCRNQKSCGTCQTTHPSCNWCTDQEFSGSYRCDVNSALQRHGCRESLIYSVRPEIKMEENLPLGTLKPDQVSIFQLQPQTVDVKAKPGEKAQFQISYLHASSETADIHMLNSVTDSYKFRINYHVKCKEQIEETNVCRDVRNSEMVVFNVTVEVEECTNENRGGAYVSVGVGGYRDITAVFVQPICGCECEDLIVQEQQSSLCNNRGNHVCGECVCEKGYSGKHCEGDGVSGSTAHSGSCDKTSEQSEAQCRQSSDKEICSGRGSCNCGVCSCTHELVEGQFCECDNAACPRPKGILCNGHGKCDCGICHCESNWAKSDCTCPTSHETCTREEGDDVCSGHGVCECGLCHCDEEYSGRHCENCLTCTDSPDGNEEHTSEEKEGQEGATSPSETEDIVTDAPQNPGTTEDSDDTKSESKETGSEAKVEPTEDSPKPEPEATAEPSVVEKTSSAATRRDMNILSGLLLLVILPLLQVCSSLSR